jgi:hypothetical protein
VDRDCLFAVMNNSHDANQIYGNTGQVEPDRRAKCV